MLVEKLVVVVVLNLVFVVECCVLPEAVGDVCLADCAHYLRVLLLLLLLFLLPLLLILQLYL